MASDRELEYELRPGRLDEPTREYWREQLRGRLTYPQIATLLDTIGVDFHALVKALDDGCDPDTAFDIFS